VFSTYIFKHPDRNDLIFFGQFKNVSVCDRKKTASLQLEDTTRNT